MAAIFYVIRNALEQCVVRDVQGRNNQQLVRGEVLRLREDEIRADVEVVQ